MTELIITSSVLILVVISLRHFLKGKISLRLQYALWALVLLRLLVPAALLESPISVMNAVRAAESARGAPVASAPAPTLSSAYGDIGAENIAVPGSAEQDVTDSVTNVTHHVFRWELLAQWVWYIGIGIVGMTLLLSNLSFGRKLRKTRIHYQTDNCKLPVYLVEALTSPCLFGLFYPAIYITPEVAGDDTKLRHVLAHELTHYRHGDHIWAALRGLILAVHWYNPLVWLAAVLSRRDAELACDEGTIKRIGEEDRMVYGRTLIGLTCEKRRAMDILCCATTMTDGKNGIKERITLIAKKPTMAVYTLIAVAVITAVTVGCTFTGANSETDDFTPDTVKMVQTLSSVSPPDPITDTETVEYLWSVYQNFEFDGTAETLDRENVWSISVSFTDSKSDDSETFSIFTGGLCLLGDDYETYYILRNGENIYKIFFNYFEAAKKVESEAQSDINISAAQAQNEITLIGPNGEKCPLKLGMGVDEATEKLETANINLRGDYTDQLFNEDYSLWFTETSVESGQEEWVLSSISVKTPMIETAEGLKTGDAEDKIEQIYGPCESVKREITEGHKYYYYEMENYLLRISSGSGEVFSPPDDPYYVFSWTISSREYSNSYFPHEVESDVLPVLLASLPDDLIYIYGDENDFNATGAYDGLYLSIHGVSRYYGWQNIGKESFLPTLSLNDINGDGQKELIVILTTGEGTGVNQKAVHVINPENFDETVVTDPLNIISDHVDTSIKHENGSVTVTITVNGQKSVVTLPEDYAQGWAEDKASFGGIVTYGVDGAELKATVPAQISNTVFAGEVIIIYAFDASQYVMKAIEYVPYEL